MVKCVCMCVCACVCVQSCKEVLPREIHTPQTACGSSQKARAGLALGESVFIAVGNFIG